MVRFYWRMYSSTDGGGISISCWAKEILRLCTFFNEILFRKIRARCTDLTVNQWLGGFESHIRSQLSRQKYNSVKNLFCNFKCRGHFWGDATDVRASWYEKSKSLSMQMSSHGLESFNAHVVQLVGDNGLRSRTVSVRIRPWAPFLYTDVSSILTLMKSSIIW